MSRRVFARAIAALALGAGWVPLAAAQTPLAGCWRMQHREDLFSNGNRRDLNIDCVLDYGASRITSRCHLPGADSERAYAYRVIEPGRMEVIPADKAPAAGSEIAYRIDGEWLVTTQVYGNPVPGKAQRPERTVTLYIRAPAAPTCSPRGESGLRVGRSPVSSLAFKAPPGWKPILVDPNNDRELGLAVNHNFFIGAFAPEAAGEHLVGVIVLDDFRYGARPIRKAEFQDVKDRLVKEAPSAQIVCDQPDRICAMLRGPRLVYTQLVNLRGRVAIIDATGATADAGMEPRLIAAGNTFVEQLRRDNR